MKKIFVRGPVLSATGYGQQSRFALRALRSRPDLFEVYIQPIPWGKSGWLWEDNELRQWIDERILVTQQGLTAKTLQPDISLQITIPNEFEKMCPINIGYTAGVETTKVSPQWLQKGNEMDKILVVSNHAKESYLNTSISVSNDEEYRLETPIDVVWECTAEDPIEDIPNFTPRHDFNFLTVSQFGPRKNFENTIKWFVENFYDKEVGLILKTHVRGSSVIDLSVTEAALKAILDDFPNRKCSVSLLHGDLSDGQMRALYEHDRVKCLVNISHGEGFGLPLFEAGRSGLPIITIPWSGQKDFVCTGEKALCTTVEYDLKPVHQEAVWEGVIQRDSQWAYAKEESFKEKLNYVHQNHQKCLQLAHVMQENIKKQFNAEVLYEGFCESIIQIGE
tara:strand:+ start:1166 stop:2341 length:1176 start_codon:yes stop_codon:yes gene_type:complete